MIEKHIDTDFVPAHFLSEAKNFAPQTREEYLEHIQRVYNYKLHTDFPLVFHIEPTNICNQACRMCCHSTQKRKQGFITDELAYKAINEAKAWGPWSTNFFFFGEPFLCKNIFKYISKAKDSGLRNISTTSNFSTVTPDEIARIPKSGLDSIHISYEGLNREHYQLARGKDHYDRVTANIYNLLEEREKQSSRLWISLTFVRTTESEEEIQQFVQKWRPIVNDLHISPQFEYRNESPDGSRRQAIAQSQSGRNDGGIMYTAPYDRVPCRQLWIRLIVTAQGDIVPCSQNIDAGLSLGKIQEITIHEAWTGQIMQSLRMQHIANCYTTKHGKICAGCTDWDWGGKVDKRPLLQQR